MAAESLPEFGRLFLSRFDIAKKSGNMFRLTLMAAVCLLNIPGLFLTDFDWVFFRCETSEEEISSSEEDG